MKVDLTDARGRRTGRASIMMKLEKPLEEADIDPMIPAGTEEREREVIVYFEPHATKLSMFFLSS